jgi:predicted nuclease of predicted toxin-antitoxin system
MKLLFDESLSPRLVQLLSDLFPEFESAFRNGLAGVGDHRILDYAVANDFILVSTDSDFERLLTQVPGAKVVILRSCNYPADVAAQVLRRNAIRLTELQNSQDQMIVLHQ